MADRYEADRERERWERERGRDPWGGRDWGREGQWGDPRREREEGGYGREGWDARREPEREREGEWESGRREWDQGGPREEDREGEYTPYGRRDVLRQGISVRERNAGRRGLNLFGTGSYRSGGSGYGTTWSNYTGQRPSYSYSGGMGAYAERGKYAGRGPRGWHRSDERIREDIYERLTDHPDIDATDIEAQVSNGEVTLTGMVESRHVKRLAEDVVEDVSGVREVHNQLRIQHYEAHEQRQGGQPEQAGGTTGAKDRGGVTNR
ncbi:MAG TPA: BON domain-containing protein [Bryobacteraceae bacterium]|nr:BON domain-containing protein [Bryobacteraceae bacterium]